MSELWPFCALEGMIEGISFKTDVIRSRDGEQRIRLTDIPRRTLNHSYRLSSQQYEQARALLRVNLPGPLWLPEWSEAVDVSVASGQTVIPVDTTIGQYYAGGSIALIQDAAGEVLEIDSLNDSSITLVTGPVDSYPDAILAPAFLAYAPEGMGLQHDAGSNHAAAMEWSIFEGPNLAEAMSLPTYRGEPMMNLCAKVGAGSLDEQTVRVVDAADNGIARPFFDNIYTIPTQTLGAAWMPTKGAEIMELRKWFYYLKGRQKAFWLPSWNNGIQLNANIAAAAPTIQIRRFGFAAAYGSGDLFIKTKAGLTYGIQVASSLASGSIETLTLTSPAPASISISDIDVFSLMFRVRLNADRIEFAHMAKYGARVVVPVIEVP